MKRALKIVLILLLVAGLLGGAGWYFLQYNTTPSVQLLVSRGEKAAAAGRSSTAIRLYQQAYDLEPDNKELALALADVYAESGNYTKAEYTLVNAISRGASVELYCALCRIYVQQDKLLDAVTMLDQIADPTLKEQLDALRPEVPTADQAPGFYSQYIEVSLESTGGTLYLSTGRDYPSVNGQIYQEPIHLGLGETTISAVAVGDNGIVSPCMRYNYTVGSVVEAVVLHDPALDSYVRDLLSRSSGSTLLTSDLWNITEMTLPEDMVNYDDMVYFTGLTSLTVENRRDVDFSFLTELSALTYLDLSGCTVDSKGINAIGTLVNLTHLELNSTGISGIGPLRDCINLVELDLSDNSIGDLLPLASCQQLQKLNLQRNAVSNLRPLTGLTALTELDVSYNSLSTISPICNNVQLEKLDVSNNNLEDLASVGNLINLKEFACHHNNLIACDELAGCVNLEVLDISNNEIESMDALVTLVKVTDMNVSYNNNRSVPDFPKDCALRVFDGSHNYFEDISGLADLKNLTNAYFDYNNIYNVNCLANCPNLAVVSCFGTNVADVSRLLSKDIVVNYNPS